MKLTTKQLTLCALLTAMALALSYLENLFPLSLAIPVPGVKLGLANIVTVFALYALGPGEALLILLARCFLGAFCRKHERPCLLPAGGLKRPGDHGPPLPAAGAFHLRRIRRRRGGPQLRTNRRRPADPGQYPPPSIICPFCWRYPCLPAD